MHRLFAALLPVLLTLLALPGLAQTSKTTAKTIKGVYYGIFLKDSKLGHMYQETDRASRYQGKPAVKVTVRTVMNIALMGADGNITTRAVLYLDPKTGMPLSESSRTEASQRVTEVTATYSARAVRYTANIQGTVKSGVLTLKPGEVFVRDPSDGPNQRPIPGTVTKGKAFSADSQTLVDMEVAVGEKEPVVVAGKTVAAYKIQTKAMVPSTSYVDVGGELLLARVALGIEIRRLPRELALATGKSVDLADSIGVRPTGLSLEKTARTSRYAVYELGGVTRSLPPKDSVQGWESQSQDDGKHTLRVTVSSPLLPTEPTVPVFAKREDAPERLQKALSSTEYVPSNDTSFIALARRIVGSETDAARVARLLAEHTHKTIKPDPSIFAVRTGWDIRKDPRGVCRDYTTYFTTLARAIGLPTKQCMGLAYANGMFLYHAWPEVWIGTDSQGADIWVALEPTWGAPFADATHLKLAEGEIGDVVNIAADMEHYTIKVLEVRE